MRFERKNAPHIRFPEASRTLMINVLLALAVLYVMATFYYGPRALALGLASLLAATLTDFICLFIYGKRFNYRDLSPMVTGLILPLLMPASIPFHIPVIAAVFAIFIVKHPFGGTGHNLFNPAAGGFAFVAVCFPQQMFLYPSPMEYLPLFPDSLVLGTSPAFSLSIGGEPGYDIVTMALGNMPGPMGATNILVLLAALIFLMSRRTVQWETPVFFLLTAALIAFWFPRAPVSSTLSVLYELMSGMLLFGAVFLLGDPVTLPKRDWARVLYGIVAAIIVMVFRRVSSLEESFVFSLLFMNAFVWLFDLLAERAVGLLRRKKFETLRTSEVQEKI